MNLSHRIAAALIGATLAAPASLAHQGEDHSKAAKSAAPPTAAAAAAAAESVAARRLDDGSAFVPKPTQRQLGVRTLLAGTGQHARTFELEGQVAADPNAGGVVQATQSGRIAPGPRGLPLLGQRVAKGAVLAYVVPSVSSLERSDQHARLAGLDAQREVAQRRLARYEQLEGSIARKDIEAARLELQGLEAQRSALGAGLATREALLAPVAGIISRSQVSAGKVVEARDVLYEIVDPHRLLVEAIAHDAQLAQSIGNASALVAGVTLKLAFLGSGRQLREQALPLLFRIEPPGAPLAVGQPLRIVASAKERVAGVRLPQSAVLRNAAGETVVWLHDSAERFYPKRVRSLALDASYVVVTEGIDPGDRVVIAGAASLAQVR
jgi:hypothetical protein